MSAPAEGADTAPARPLGLLVLISGSGSNLQALIDAQQAGLPLHIRAVVSNVADAFGLERARRHGIPTQVLSHRDYPDRTSYDADLKRLMDAHAPDVIALAGFMRILTPALVDAYRGRLLNIHPSLLPKYRGLHTHQRVLDAGEREHGATVHFVTPELDGGPPILQARVPVHADDDAERLAARVLHQEHRIYPQVIEWLARGRLRLGADDVPYLDGEPLHQPRQLVTDAD